MLNVKNVSKSFGHLRVFSDLSFDLSQNSILGIAGPSGSGKSTLLHCIQGLEKFSVGKAAIAGKSVLMFQDFQLFPHMTVLENLVYAPNLHMKSAETSHLALQLLTQLKLESKVNAYPYALSGGQKQRVALARCLMIKPSLLLCDEPTSGLDVGSIAEVILLLKSVKELGVTMVIASHDLNFLLEISDEVMVLREGQKMVHKEAHLFKGSDLQQYLV